VATVPGPAGAQSAAPVEIVTVAVVDGQIVIDGANFGPSPSAVLGGEPVSVASLTETRLVGEIANLKPGVYELRVVREPDHAPEDSARTTVTIPRGSR
jgi:hypothetical protein